MSVYVERNRHFSDAGYNDQMGELEYSLRLEPSSAARPQPDYIPRAIVEDYEEACRILELSPKASATLSRRALQGMIRDFCKITKPTLFKEIEALSEAIENDEAPKGVLSESVEAIDQVRQVGNIGAHMEKDVNTIVPIEPDEAASLIELIEMLFAEWYVARHQRQQRLSRIKGISEQKRSAKESNDSVTD